MMYENNEGTLRHANNPLSSVHFIHIEVRYHLNEGRVLVLHVKTEGQHIDLPSIFPKMFSGDMEGLCAVHERGALCID